MTSRAVVQSRNVLDAMNVGGSGHSGCSFSASATDPGRDNDNGCDVEDMPGRRDTVEADNVGGSMVTLLLSSSV